jgi:phosphatidylglycerol:prolipoprotein diacylglycerol transferase
MDLIWGLLGLVLAARDIILLYAAYWVATDLAKRHASAVGLDAEIVADVAYWLAIGALVGARLAYIVPAWPTYLRYPLDILRLQSGLSFYGALGGATVVAAWLGLRTALPLARIGDLLAPYTALGIGVQRAGCVVRGDCFGTVAPAPFGLVFPGLTQPRYPAELYEAVLALALFAGLTFWHERRRFDGELVLALVLLYLPTRAFVDLFRINLAGIPTAEQVMSVGVAAVSGAVLLRCYQMRYRRTLDSGPTPVQTASPSNRGDP